MNLLDELQRRNVLRAAVLHVGAAWALAHGFALPGWSAFAALRR